MTEPLSTEQLLQNLVEAVVSFEQVTRRPPYYGPAQIRYDALTEAKEQAAVHLHSIVSQELTTDTEPVE